MNRMKHMVVATTISLTVIVGFLSPTILAGYTDSQEMIQQEKMNFELKEPIDKASYGIVDRLRLMQEVTSPVKLTFDDSKSDEKAQEVLRELEKLFSIMQMPIDLSRTEIDAQQLYYYMDSTNKEKGLMAWYIEIIDPVTDFQVEVTADDNEGRILSILVNDRCDYYQLSITKESFKQTISYYLKYLGIEEYTILEGDNDAFIYKENNGSNELEYRIKICEQNSSCEIRTNYNKFGFAINWND